MKLALLNIRIDANYGGNLQRYALMTVLARLGHDVTHLNLQRKWSLPWYKAPFCFAKRCFLKCILKKKVLIFSERFYQRDYEKQLELISPFYGKYIKHTDPIYSYDELFDLSNQYDGFVVGSDQVWRKSIVQPFPLKMFFLDFVKKNIPKIAYSVSLGTDDNELNDREISGLKSLYHQFNAVSVREKSGLSQLKSYDWTFPAPELLVDPTLLLEIQDYISLVENAATDKFKGEILCYILDMSDAKKNEVEQISNRLKKEPYYVFPNTVSIEQWLRDFMDAEYIVTDSFHGFVFSVIFNKPVRLLFNKHRGNARFDSLIELLNFNVDEFEQDWAFINKKIEEERRKALLFLNLSLKAD